MSFVKTAVIGAGSWGTALATLLAERGLPVTLWGHEAESIGEIQTHRTNARYLPGIVLPDSIEPTTRLDDACDAGLILLVPPSRAMREVSQRLSACGVPAGAALLSCTKGIERGTGARMSQILAESFPDNPVAVLSGPSHAEEVARRMPTAVVIGCADHAIAERIQRAVSGEWFRAYTSDDVAGIELGGALKNVFAIAAGISDGLGFGDNTKAALVTRALAELIRLGGALGGRRETFQGLSGIGDLIVTCFSRHSRNRGVGERLGKGERVDAITNSMAMVAEGVPTALSAFECARSLGISAPITSGVHAILYEEKSPRVALGELLAREPKPEQER